MARRDREPQKPDTGNAHLRTEQSKRQAPSARAEEAQRLLDDPAFQRGFSAVHEGVVNEISNLKHDGQPETDNYERELCRTLRTLHSLKRALSLGVQGQALRVAEFRPREPEANEG